MSDQGHAGPHAAMAAAPVPPPILVVDGQPMDPTAPAVSAFDRGLLLGDGVFDTMRLSRGRPFRRAAHVDRLARSAAWLGILEATDAASRVDDALDVALALAEEHGMRDGSIRTTLTRGVGAPGLSPAPGARPTLIVAVHPRSDSAPALPAPITAVVTTTGRRNEHSASGSHKTLAYADAVIALRDARERGASDAIFLDSAGRVTCGTASNVILVLRGVVTTPPAGGAVLPGITRLVAFEVARALDLIVEERPVAAEELERADELWLTSSIRGVAPVTRLDGRPVGTGAPGATWRHVVEAFEAVVARECGA